MTAARIRNFFPKWKITLLSGRRSVTFFHAQHPPSLCRSQALWLKLKITANKSSSDSSRRVFPKSASLPAQVHSTWNRNKGQPLSSIQTIWKDVTRYTGDTCSRQWWLSPQCSQKLAIVSQRKTDTERDKATIPVTHLQMRLLSLMVLLFTLHHKCTYFFTLQRETSWLQTETMQG